MRIKDQINFVVSEFVSFEEVFKALCIEQELEPYQALSWLIRKRSELKKVQMLECNQELFDYYLPDDEKSYIDEFLYNGCERDDFDWTESNHGEGYVAGWIFPEIKDFFKSVDVEFPEKTIMAMRSGQRKESILDSPKAGNEEVVSKAIISNEANEKQLTTKERTTLLTIIAALAEEAKVSLLTPSKSAEYIAGVTNHMGAPVAKRTIEEHLKRIPEAVDRRTR